MRWLASLALVAGVAHAADTRVSGFAAMSPAVQAMQKNDAENPAMLWVEQGRELWSAKVSGTACADCHGAPEKLKGVAARYPAWDAIAKRPILLQERIEACRRRHQKAPPLPPEHADRLALEALVSLQSRGQAIAPYRDARLSPFFTQGEAHWRQRMGQLNLSCANCHDERPGLSLAGTRIPQAHPTAYPLYRLEWQAVGSLTRRIRNCMTGVRAEPFAADGPDIAALAVYLASRAAGMAVESPGVRP